MIKRTNANEHPRGVQGTSRLGQTYKRKRLLVNDDENRHTKEGDGIQFLPGDIKGLDIKLNYLLLAEFAAGNRSSTRDQIVAILDELKGRKRISQKDYTDIN